MARDRVRPMKWEDPSEGGTETDEVPTELDPHEDHVDACGYMAQHPGPPETNDEDVGWERDSSGNMVLRDKNQSPITLSELAGSSPIASSPVPFSFRGDGHFRSAEGIDIIEADKAFTISLVSVRRAIAGTGGTTEIDILKNGSTIFTTTLNRPKIDYTEGDNARVEATPDVTSVAVGDKLEMVIISAETGNPQDLVAMLRT